MSVTIKLVTTLTRWFYKEPILKYLKHCIVLSVLELTTLLIGKIFLHSWTNWLYSIYCTFYLISSLLMIKKVLKNITNKYGPIYNAILQDEQWRRGYENVQLNKGAYGRLLGRASLSHKNQECKKMYNKIPKKSIHHLQIYLKILIVVNVVKFSLLFFCLFKWDTLVANVLRDWLITILNVLICIDILYGYHNDIITLWAILIKTMDKEIRRYFNIYVVIYVCLLVIAYIL